ncbi:unnamed protein product [Tilletia controversa]|uniref:Uncharacterized protein n=1 Tax=Tilletia controversa TaxID=13291 RepID=A0A8X7SV85_9BASI|nr:hypothetical protein CF328_g6740 [Tilletia controversa]KAE8243370.1 hypothetical protein A4X06_0g6365 [Tilletia controversa]CAD6899192.1 unnamed protein product [Tilletia controversa]CAD6962491.1 unnamed protein product [Tilletia controversa]CAD6969752.1 unnamed protein product [Tilletia controversa]
MSISLSRIVHLSQRRHLTEDNVVELGCVIKKHISDNANLIDPRWLVPNHHALLHLPQHIRRFGPAPRFWFYAHERLNGLLKNTNHNNHLSGELELALHNAYLQFCTVKNTINDLQTDDPMEAAFASIMATESVSRDQFSEHPDRRWGDVVTVGTASLAELTMPEIREVTELIRLQVSPADLPVSWDLHLGNTPENDNPMHHRATTFDKHISSFDSILVHNSVVTRTSTRTNVRAGGAHLVVRHDGQNRLGLFQHAFSHPYVLRSTGDVNTEMYVSIVLYESIEWPAGHVLGGQAAETLGYMLFGESQESAVMVRMRDVIDTFISTTASHIFENNNTTICCAARLHP